MDNSSDEYNGARTCLDRVISYFQLKSMAIGDNWQR